MSADGLVFLHEAFAAAGAMMAAEKLGVLARLRAGPADVRALARECEISERGAGALLSALAGLELVEPTGGGGYRASDGVIGELSALDCWRLLVDVIRHGGEAMPGGSPIDDMLLLYGDGLVATAEQTTPAAAQAAEHLAFPGVRALDVGAGVRPWSIALAQREPSCHVTVLGLPGALPEIRHAVATAGCESQFSYLRGDPCEAALGACAYDLVIAGTVCHLLDEQSNRGLLNRARDALRPRGRVAVVDTLPNEGLDGPRPAVLYALSLLVRTAVGRLYPFSTYVSWLRDAGFEGVERLDLGAHPPFSLITAHSPR